MPDQTSHRITKFIAQLTASDRDSRVQAQRAIFDEYWHQLCRLAEARLSPQIVRHTAPEDVANSALKSFFNKSNSKIADHNSLEGSLIAIVINKCCDVARKTNAAKRKGVEIIWDENLLTRMSAGATPEEVRIAEELIEALPATLNRVADLKFQGHSIDEIANHLGVSSKTIQRSLKRIREIWSA
jgi:RNA polymerase sigma-70 factor, ECF subfamily